MMRPLFQVACLLVLFVTSGCSLLLPEKSFPSYTVLRQDGEFEIRNYDANWVMLSIWVETKEEPVYEELRAEAVAALQAYADGDNQESKVISFAPLIVAYGNRHITIDGVSRYNFTFIRPYKVSEIGMLPEPNDPRIERAHTNSGTSMKAVKTGISGVPTAEDRKSLVNYMENVLHYRSAFRWQTIYYLDTGLFSRGPRTEIMEELISYSLPSEPPSAPMKH